GEPAAEGVQYVGGLGGDLPTSALWTGREVARNGTVAALRGRTEKAQTDVGGVNHFVAVWGGLQVARPVLVPRGGSRGMFGRLRPGLPQRSLGSSVRFGQASHRCLVAGLQQIAHAAFKVVQRVSGFFAVDGQ